MNLRGWLECLGAVQIGRKRLLDHVYSHNSAVLFISLASRVLFGDFVFFTSCLILFLLRCLLWSMMDHSSSLDKRRHSLNKCGVIESFHDDPNAPKWQWTMASLASRHRTMTRYVRMWMMERTHQRRNTAHYKTRSISFSAGLKTRTPSRLYTEHLTVRTHTRFFLVRTKHVMTALVAPDCQVLRVSQNHFISDHVSLECSLLSFSSDSHSSSTCSLTRPSASSTPLTGNRRLPVPLRREVECLAI